MAQARVTEFFNAKKRTSEFQPSKRRKLARTLENDSTIQQEPSTLKSPPIAARTRRGKTVVAPPQQKVPKASSKTRKQVEKEP